MLKKKQKICWFNFVN